MAGLLDRQEQGAPQPRAKTGGMPPQAGGAIPQQGAPQPGMQEQARPVPGEPRPQQQGMAPEGGSGEESNVSPEEQSQYEQFVTNGMRLMYDEKMMPEILRGIGEGGNPVEGIANTLTMVVMRLEESAQEQGREISGDVKLHAATELLEQMVELAEAAGIHEFSPEEIESAYYLALDNYRAMRQEQGDLPMDEINRDMQEIVAAEQQGSLDQVLPGISEYAKRAPQPEQAPQQQPTPPQGGGGLMNQRG